jgi:oligopeptidase B
LLTFTPLFVFPFFLAKWVAKLREMKTDKNPLLLKTDLSSGHFSASDRYKFLKETAFEYSFILNQIEKK